MPGQPLIDLHPKLAAYRKTGGRIIVGDPMSGHAIDFDDSAPAERSLLTLLPPSRPMAAQPCINCGWCVDVCPTGLDPVRMDQQIHTGDHNAWLGDQLVWCIDCGLCSYVCPSCIPLAQRFRDTRRQLERLER